MKPGLVEIVCVVDRSGSMDAIKQDAIGAFNAFLDEQKKHPGEARLTLTLFNHTYQIVHSGLDLKDVPNLDEKSYVPSGMTALLDAVGRTLDDVEGHIQTDAESDRPEKVLFVIVTDGEENSSKEYTHEQVKQKMDGKKAQGNWEFVFLAAGLDAFKEARSMGFANTSIVNYASNDSQAYLGAVRGMSIGTSAYRSGQTPDWQDVTAVNDEINRQETELLRAKVEEAVRKELGDTKTDEKK